MKVKHLLLCSVVALPALLLPLASCDDSNSPTEPSATPSDQPELSVASTRNNHDPRSQPGQKIRTFDGTRDVAAHQQGTCGLDNHPCDYTGTSKRNRTEDGAEVNTLNPGADGSYGGIYPQNNLIKGKLLTQVRELDFSFAGGPPSGGAPRFSIPIDCDQGYEGVGTAPCRTDGKYDHFAFTDANGCNDGDSFVGTIEADDNPNCLINYNNVENYPNWKAFVAAHPGARIARDQTWFIIVDQPAHYLLWKVDVR